MRRSRCSVLIFPACDVIPKPPTDLTSFTNSSFLIITYNLSDKPINTSIPLTPPKCSTLYVSANPSINPAQAIQSNSSILTHPLPPHIQKEKKEKANNVAAQTPKPDYLLPQSNPHLLNARPHGPQTSGHHRLRNRHRRPSVGLHEPRQEPALRVRARGLRGRAYDRPAAQYSGLCRARGPGKERN